MSMQVLYCACALVVAPEEGVLGVISGYAIAFHSLKPKPVQHTEVDIIISSFSSKILHGSVCSKMTVMH